MGTKPTDFHFFIERLKKIPSEEIKRRTNKARDSASEEFKSFSELFPKGKCYLCGDNLSQCNQQKPCLHWLLRSHKKIKKKNIKQVLEMCELFQVITYLRWVAKTESHMGQINDLEAYEQRKKLTYQENIKYKQMEWTFWIKEEDLQGHGRDASDFPHYHMQITINNMPFVNFNDFHIRLSEWEIFNIHARRGEFPEYKFTFPHGESYVDLSTFYPKMKYLKK